MDDGSDIAEGEMPEKNDPAVEIEPDLAASDRSDLAAVAARTRARWKADLEAKLRANPPKEETEADFPAAISNRTALDDMMGGNFEKRLAELRRQTEEHRSACVAVICDWCERFGCEECKVVRVPTRDESCRDCRVRKALPGMMIPRRYLEARENIRARVRSRKALRLAEQALFARAVVLKGHAGSGKTTLMCGMATGRAYALVDRGVRWPKALFVSAIELGLARQRHRLGDGEAEVVLDAMGTELLLLDDLGAEGVREAEVIIAVLHERHNEDLATWITTSLSPEEVGARYGGGVERRIFEDAVILNCEAAVGE